MREIITAPKADIYLIDASFHALRDKSERDYLDQLLTSFVLLDEAVDRLRATARTIIHDRLLFHNRFRRRGAQPRHKARG